MVKPTHPISTLTLAIITALTLLATGCGGSTNKTASTANSKTASTANSNGATTAGKTTPQTTTTHSTPASAPIVEKVELSSPAFPNEGLIPTRYTCDGANTPPPIHWKGIPPGTVELVLEILNIQPVNGKLYYHWAITGLNPTSHGITNGKLPPGATLITNSTGQTKYSLCPQHHGTQESYVAVLFALNHKLQTTPNTNAATLHDQAYKNSKYEAFLLFKNKK